MFSSFIVDRINRDIKNNIKLLKYRPEVFIKMLNLNISKINLINLLIASIIPFLILGPFLPDLIVSISTIFFLYYIFRYKKFNFLHNKSIILFFLFCFICIFCSLFAEDIFVSLKSSIFYFRIGIFCCFIWYLIEEDKSILTYFYYAIVICFLLLVLDGYYQYFNGENILGYKKYGIRVASFFGDEMIMGSYLSRLFPLLFALFLIKEKKNYEIFFIGLLFVLVDILIFISGERTAFFFLNLSTIFIIILIKRYQIFRLVTFVIAIICVLLLSMNSPRLTERMIMEPSKNLNFLNSSEQVVIFTKAHDSHIRTAFEMFKDSPIIGHGPKMFRVKCSDPKYIVGNQPCSSHPHNFYIQLLSETGIFGFFYLLLMFLYVLYCALRQIKSIFFDKKRFLTDYQVALLGGILITVWPLSPNGSFFHNWLMIVYGLPVGFYLHSLYSKKV